MGGEARAGRRRPTDVFYARGRPLRHPLASLLIVVISLGVACSVTTPRDEALTLRGTDSMGSQIARPGDGNTAGVDGITQPDNASAGESGARAATADDARPSSGGDATPIAGSPLSDSRASGDTDVRTVGVSADSIAVSVALPFSGPLGQLYEGFYQTAAVTWAEDVNERGGIHGRKIVLKKVDNRGTVDGQVAACREIQSNGSFVAIIDGSISDTEADCLDEARFPAMMTLAGARNPRWSSVRALVSAEHARTLASFIGGPLAAATKKLGVIYLENYTNYKDAAVEAAREARIDIVRVEVVTSNQASFTAELLRLRQSGAEVVAIITAQEVIGILRDARAVGYQPLWTGLPWPGDELSLAAGDLMTGIRALRYWTAVESPAGQRYRELVAKHGNGVPTSASMAVYGPAVVLGRAIELAGPRLDRTTIRAGFDAMEHFDAGVVPPVSFANGRTVGTNAQFPLRCCNSRREWVGIGPAAERF